MIKKIGYVFSAAVFSVFVSCSDFHNDLFTEIKSIAGGNGTEIRSFSLCGTELTIAGNTITGNIPFYENIYSAAASFKTNGAEVRVDGVTQKSGSTVNDFSGDVVYTVYSNNGTSRQYTVSVTNYAKVSTFANVYVSLTGITTDNSYLYVSTSSYVFAYDFAGGCTNYDAPSGATTLDIQYANGKFYLLYSDGSSCYVESYYSLSNMAFPSSPMGFTINGISSDGAYLYFACNDCVWRYSFDYAVSEQWARSGATFYDVTVKNGIAYGPSNSTYNIISKNISTGTMTEFAGNGNQAVLDGAASEASFYSPRAIANDGENLYISDNATIRKINIASGMVSTIAGLADYPGADDGLGPNARFSSSCSGLVWFSARQELYVADTSNSLIRSLSAQ